MFNDVKLKKECALQGIPFKFKKTIKMKDIDVFFEAIRSGDKDRLEALININPNLVSAKDTRGFTPLILATYFDNEVATQFLIENNADLNGKDASGNTALIGVSFKGNLALATTLVERGADLNAVNNLGVSALIFATQYNNVAIVKLLLEHQADKSITDNDGKTALDYAKDKKFTELIGLLN